MRKTILGAILLSALVTGCNLQSAARVESIHLMNEGIKQLAKNNMSGAEKALQEAVQADPTHALAHYNLAKLYRKQGKLADAEKAYEQAIASNPSEPNWKHHYEKGLVQSQQGSEGEVSTAEKESQYQKAIASFQEAIKHNPNAYKAQYQMGVLLEKLDQPEQADQAFRQCIEINAKYSPCFVSLGNMYIDYGHSNVAMSVLDAGAQINDTDAEMWNGLGRAYRGLNKPKEAVDAFKKAKAIDPDRPDVLFGLGMSYADLRMRSEAEEALNAFMQKAGSDVPEDTREAAQKTLARMQDVI